MSEVALELREGVKNRIWCLYTQTRCRRKSGETHLDGAEGCIKY